MPDAARALARNALARNDWTQARPALVTALTPRDAGLCRAAVFWSRRADEKSGWAAR